MVRISINHSIDLSMSFQAARDSVNKMSDWYFQVLSCLTVDLPNPIQMSFSKQNVGFFVGVFLQSYYMDIKDGVLMGYHYIYIYIFIYIHMHRLDTVEHTCSMAQCAHVKYKDEHHAGYQQVRHQWRHLGRETECCDVVFNSYWISS